MTWPNQSAAANRRPAEQSGGSDNLSAIVAADRAYPAAAAELDRSVTNRRMLRTSIIAVLALALGIMIGWKARSFAADGHDGIQWRFNDAAGRGDLEEMKRLISAGADPRAFPSYADGAVTGASPLLEAAWAGEPESVESLILKGADVNKVEATETPLDMAEYRRSQADETIKILKAHGAKNLHELSSPQKTTKTEQLSGGNGGQRR